MRIRLLLALGLVLVILVSGGCAAVSGKPSSSFDHQLGPIVQPYSFNFTSWEINTLYNDIRQKLTGPQPATALKSSSVVNYFSYITQLNTLKSDLKIMQSKISQGDIAQYEAKISEVSSHIAALKPVVEQTIARQINETLAEQGIYHPFGDNWYKIIFPPVNFKLEKPLYMLIVSPRDKIQKEQSITIKPDINTAQMEELESSVVELDVSALVVQIGGLGATYPTFVVNNADLRFTIDTAVEEWLHQYLAFKPLGFRYVLDLLGISKDASISTINETAAGIVSQELGAQVYNKYYSQYQTSPRERAPAISGFDFNAAMRETRKMVDIYLSQGQIEQAEKYMEEQRQYLASKGYYIRKLNQAYFAFYGSYAYSPTSVDPIGNEIRLLREHSPSLKYFLSEVADLRGKQDLRELVSRYE